MEEILKELERLKNSSWDYDADEFSAINHLERKINDLIDVLEDIVKGKKDGRIN